MLLASDGSQGDFLGESVDIDGEWMVVGAIGDELPGENVNTNRGAAYVFRKVGSAWVEHQKLVPSESFDDQQFGGSVAIVGDVIAVGARSATEFAYVFRLDGDTWVEEATLTPIGGGLGGFGESVDIAGGLLVVGAPLDSDIAFWSGAAHVFEYVNGAWEPRIKLLASDGHEGARFGSAVDIDAVNERIFVGAPRQDTVIIDAFNVFSGAAYVFESNGEPGSPWREVSKLKPQDGMAALFGDSLDVDGAGDRIVIGAPGSFGTGAAFVFELRDGTWTQRLRIFANDPGLNDEFGSSVAIDGDAIIVGAHEDGGPPDEPNEAVAHGSAYLFHLINGEWTQTAKLAGSTVFNLAFANLGVSVAISGDDAIAGAHRGVLPTPGQVFVYDARPPVEADLTGDNNVNGVDLANLLARWGECDEASSFPCNPNPCNADLDNDGVVNARDLAHLLRNWTAAVRTKSDRSR